MKHKIKNTSSERQSVHTTSGAVFIHPGQERDEELTPAGLKFAKAADYFTLEEIADPEKAAELKPPAGRKA